MPHHYSFRIIVYISDYLKVYVVSIANWIRLGIIFTVRPTETNSASPFVPFNKSYIAIVVFYFVTKIALHAVLVVEAGILLKNKAIRKLYE